MSARRLPPVKLALVLPVDAREALVRAAKTVIPKNDPLARVKAIEKAIAHAKFQYPQFFKHLEL